MQKSKLDIMEEFQTKLQDILNSQESLVEKMGVVQVELFNHPDKTLESVMEEMTTQASNTYTYIAEEFENYETRVNVERSEQTPKKRS